MGLFNDRIQRDGKTQIPVWFMRQAGRYHAHYQNIRKDHEFMKKNPQLAHEITHGGRWTNLTLMRQSYLVTFSFH